MITLQNNNIGKVIGDYQIISYNPDIKKYDCQCVKCGHIRTMKMGDFNRRPNIHEYKNCKEDYVEYEYPNRKGDYILKEGSKIKRKGHILYEIECKICGNTKFIEKDRWNSGAEYYHSVYHCGDNVYNDKIGQQFEDIIIDKYVGKTGTSNPNPLYECHCVICGRKKVMQFSNIYTHKGTTHHNCSKAILNEPHIKAFRSKWCDMRERTTNPKNDHYAAYGGRGITSEDYKNFIDFYDDMYKSFIEHVNEYGVKDTSLERIDVNKSYTKDNIKWITMKEQHDNKQKTVYFKVTQPNGEYTIERNLHKYEIEHGFSNNFIRNKLYGIVKDNTWNGITYELVDKAVLT